VGRRNRYRVGFHQNFFASSCVKAHVAERIVEPLIPVFVLCFLHIAATGWTPGQGHLCVRIFALAGLGACFLSGIGWWKLFGIVVLSIRGSRPGVAIADWSIPRHNYRRRSLASAGLISLF